MKHISIKALYPGCGKTYTLCKLFIESDLQNKLIITPTNKARHVCVQKLVDEFGMKHCNAEHSVVTMRKFKGNYTRITYNNKQNYLPTTTRTKTWKHFYNIFIDEVSMLSDYEIRDLIENVPIENLITAGDENQFNPIGESYLQINSHGDYIMSKDGEILRWIDNGDPMNIHIDEQFILNKSFRSVDLRLNNLLAAIKAGDFAMMDAEFVNLYNRNSQYYNFKDKALVPGFDFHEWQMIAYTNKVCNFINALVDNPCRWIVKRNDFSNDNPLSKGDLIDQYTYENLRCYKDEEFISLGSNMSVDDWCKMTFAPAYAITAHKLQGETIKDFKIGVVVSDYLSIINYHKDRLDTYSEDASNHIVKVEDDFFGSNYEFDDEYKQLSEELKKTYEERIATFQKFLYVAISRATSINNVFMFFNGVKYDDFKKVISQFKPMVDDFLPNAVYGASNEDFVHPTFYTVTQDEINEWKEKWRHLSYDKREIDYDKREIDYDKRKPKAKVQDNDEIVNDAKNMSFKEWQAKYNKGKSSYYRCRNS